MEIVFHPRMENLTFFMKKRVAKCALSDVLTVSETYRTSHTYDSQFKFNMQMIIQKIAYVFIVQHDFLNG